MSYIQGKEVVLSERDNSFIDCLLTNGGNIRAAARDAGFAQDYGYAVYRRLAKHIAEAAQEYIAIHSVRAAQVTIDQMEAEVPNPIRLAAAQAVLDRAGVVKQDLRVQEVTIGKANIFILPEKRELPAIDVAYEQVQ